MTVFWLDREGALNALRQAAEKLGRERSEVIYVGLFGSLAQNRAVPGSDADVVVLIERSEQRFMDRPLDYMPYFSVAGLPVDLFCYTPQEAGKTPLARNALANAVRLWSRNTPLD